MSDLVTNMYFPSSNNKLVQKPFQCGILISIKSTISLYRELKTEGASFLLTSRINQDGLENLFSTVRLMGGNNSHPSSVEVSNILRKLCITENVKIVVNNPAVETCDEDEFVSAELFDSVVDDLIDDDIKETVTDVTDEFHEFGNETSNEGRNYVAGYICRKLKLKPNTETNANSWISLKGEGRLLEPSSDLVKLCEKCDQIFDAFNGKSVRICHDPLGKLISCILSKHPSFPPDIVELFCKVKFYSRIKDENKKVKIKTLNKTVRSLKQMAQFMN